MMSSNNNNKNSNNNDVDVEASGSLGTTPSDAVVNGHHSLPSPDEVKMNTMAANGGTGGAWTPAINRRCKILSVVAIVAAIITIISLSVAMAQRNSGGGGGGGGRGKLSYPSRADDVIGLLASVTPRAVLDDEDTPQHKAAVWLADYDERRLGVPLESEPLIDGGSDARHFVQRYVLATVFYAMDGENWRYGLDFLTGRHECDWHQYFVFYGRGMDIGVTCDFDFRVKKLINVGNRVRGTIPPEIGLLTDLVEVSLFSNDISGSLPSEVGKLSQLDFLAVQHNSLAGPFPEWLVDMPTLKVLSMGHNMLTGQLPQSMSRMNLEELYLDQNSLIGDVHVLTEISTLRSMYLDNNDFTGNLQDIFADAASSGNLQSLKDVDLSGNQIEGTLPRALLNLRLLDLHDNKLSGPLPAPTGSGEETFGIEFLALFKNQMSGELPSSVLMMPKLTHLDLSLNRFSGEMPSFGSSMSQLEYLFLAKNQFAAGPVPSSMQELVHLRELSLQNTSRTGTIPNFFGGDVASLVMLDLSENQLNGNIPSTLGGLYNCSFLLLNDNQLDGYVPDSFSKLENLVLLLLDGNELAGSASPVCDTESDSLEIFIADCISEMTCPCCTTCCSDEDTLCNNRSWLANYDPNWETGYSRVGKEYNFAEDMKLVAPV